MWQESPAAGYNKLAQWYWPSPPIVPPFEYVCIAGIRAANVFGRWLVYRSTPRTLEGDCAINQNYSGLRRTGRFAWLSAALVGGILFPGLVGCGGGSSVNGQPNIPGALARTVAGAVTDLHSAPLVGATVTLGNQTATTTQSGAFVISAPALASGETSLITPITATATVSGHAWSGQNTVEILASDSITRNVVIVVSDSSQQGALAGKVVNQQGAPLPGAHVSVALPDPTNAAAFTGPGSIIAIAAQDGTFSVPKLPAANGYSVTASAAGYNNQSQTVPVNAGATTPVNFTLAANGTSAILPAVQNFTAVAITLPPNPTRAIGASNGLAAIEQWILNKRGLGNRRAAAAASIQRRRRHSARSPLDHVIEAVLSWDYQPIANLLGYDVVRATNINQPNPYSSIALLRDPLADQFYDQDPALTPDQSTYYSVARLDTAGYPANGTEGTPATPVAVDPLDAMTLAQPAAGAALTATPSFVWLPVARASLYQILVYDTFPTLQSDTDPAGTKPIWPADASAPGASLVQAPSTTQTYQGPALTSGHTYYWAVVASDSVNADYSISPIFAFTAP
ncbi:MAG TPA: carboxypeptidase-like regulatory domain-containing protein [Chthonomonadales bacterium]|nr:carboxypeptidase-like regulatory domain-containing protein [Chthonomonadales bacterium]